MREPALVMLLMGILLAGCPPAPQPGPARLAPAKDVGPAAPRQDPPDGAEPRDSALLADRTAAEPEASGTGPPGRGPGRGSISKDTWNGCVGAYVEGQSEQARGLLIDALSTYWTECDKVERWIAFSTPRPMPSGHDYLFTSNVSLVGHLAKGRSAVWLSLSYRGDDGLFAKRITIAADELRWTSPPLTFNRDGNAGQIWETATLPYTRKLLPILRQLVNAKESIVRFEGRGHEDLTVTAEMKQDLKLMMDALAAVGIP